MHGNKLDNLKPHHLYVIFRLSNFEVFKYGISDDPIDDFDGLSARVRDQVEEWNMAAEYQKFDAKILATDIAGRALKR
jgi:hypothetical protein